MMIPTIHLNGTGKQTLMMELEEAYKALATAEKKLMDVTVNGRDYYVQGPHAYGQARNEMDARLQAIRTVINDIEEMRIGIYDQGRR